MRLIVTMAAMAALGCTSATPAVMTPEERTAIKDTVSATMTQLAREVSAQGFVAWLPYLERSEDFVWTADGEIAFPSADSLDKFIRDFAATLTHTELTFTEVRVAPLGPGAAQVATRYRELFVGKAADTTRVNGVFIGVWVRSPAGWRLAAGHTSHAPAPH